MGKSLGLCLLLACAAGAAETVWHEALAPHFEVHHEPTFMPPGFLMALEKIHGRLRLDLAMFAPWMAKERIKLYLHKDRDTYVNGEFTPPAWSNGIAYPGKKTVVVPDNPDRKEVLGVIAHETTHLLFESYWEESHKRPPSWLNEGLATFEEAATSDKLGRAPWYRAMVSFSEGPTVPMDKFLSIVPTQDSGLSDKALEDWYCQSFSIVTFFYQKHSRLQFKSFVSYLRDGKTLDEALWLTYRYQNADKFEKSWKLWLKDPKHRLLVESAGEAPAGKQAFAEPIGKIGSFKPLK